MNEADIAVQQLLAQDATGMVTSSVADGSFFGMDSEDASLLAATASGNADLCSSVGKKVGLKGPASPQVVHDTIMSEYVNEAIRRNLGFGIEMSEAETIDLADRRTDSLFGLGSSEADRERVIADAANGDYSPLLRVKENYYFS